MEQQGYYRFPCLGKNCVFFVCEDDIWKVSIDGGVASRFTKTPGIAYEMSVSADGKWLAYSAGDYGSAEVYCVATDGGEARRLTFHPSQCNVVGWDGSDILFTSNMEGTHAKDTAVYRIDKNGGHWQKLPFGLGHKISIVGKTVALQRGYSDPACWKSYRGGRTGKIWLKTQEQAFRLLTKDQESQCFPMICNDRVYFLYDTSKQGNIFSYTFDGKDLQQHTFHEDMYVRRPNLFAEKIVYQLGGEIYILNLTTNASHKLEIDLQSCSSSVREKFVLPNKYLTGHRLSPNDNDLLITTRGQLFCMKTHSGAVIRFGEASQSNHRFAQWTGDGKHIVVISDTSGEEEIIVFNRENGKEVQRLGSIGSGGFIERILPAPVGDEVAVAVNAELYIVNWQTQEVRSVDKGKSRYFRDFSWSPDAKWLAYSKYEEQVHASIFLYDVTQQEVTRVTTPDAHDYCPRFSSHGKYLYFLSKRVLNPYADSLQFEYSFPESAKPYLVVLDKEGYSPFSPMYEAGNEKEKDQEPVTKIDVAGIQKRIVEIPVKEGLYLQLSSFEDKVFLLKKPLEGRLEAPKFWQDKDQPTSKLVMYDLKNKKEETVVDKLTSYSHGGKKMLLRVGKSLCAVVIGSSYKKMYEKPSEKSGWIDLRRIKLCVNPRNEWQQIFLQAWRLQRDFFWKELHDWEKVREKYRPLVERVRTRNELADVIGEMHGDLETSHAYTFLGDQANIIHQRIGMLGIRTELIDDKFVIKQFFEGDLAHHEKGCPFLEPGMNIKEGDAILAVNGQIVGQECHLNKALINLAKEEVELSILTTENEEKRVTVKTLVSDVSLRYRDWVNKNRDYVTQKTTGRIGYLHVPDMSTEGLISFHRDFLWQYVLEGLIVDVRFNGGGNISPLLIEKLQRKTVAHLQPRRGKKIFYPRETLQGPVVVLCNEYTGSDGDIFCQVFKTLGLGALIGTRTWGGIIGIVNDKTLVDKGIVTQPEYAFYFNDGSEIEGIGVAPDIWVENTPEAYAAGKDLQLDRAIETLLKTQKMLFVLGVRLLLFVFYPKGYKFQRSSFPGAKSPWLCDCASNEAYKHQFQRTFADKQRTSIDSREHILGEVALQNEFTIFAQELCQEAGKILLDFYGKLNNENIAQKNKHDFVTDADKASEKFIVAKIEQRYPLHGIHGEEFTSKEAQSEYTWFIDPLDGTTNFVHGHPFFAISMGLRCADELICGVVYSPILNEMFYAAVGEGAYLNGRRIYTSDTTTLENSLLATGFPYKKAEIERNNLRNFNCLLPQVRGVRRCGAAAIDMCYVACGRYDGFWELWLQPHDVAAGTVIVREAGGIVTDFCGGEGYLFAGNVLATNKHIYSSLQKNVVF